MFTPVPDGEPVAPRCHCGNVEAAVMHVPQLPPHPRGERQFVHIDVRAHTADAAMGGIWV